MSRLKSKEEYEKTRAFRFFRWLSGVKDPYVGEMEMHPQEEYKIEETTILERMQEKQMLRDKIYDVEHNKLLVAFHKVYVICAIIFCKICLYIDDCD